MNEYSYVPDDEVMRIAAYILEKYRRAFVALANADSIEDGEKYFADDND